MGKGSFLSVSVVTNVAGASGRDHLSGIFKYVNTGKPWRLQLLNNTGELLRAIDGDRPDGAITITNGQTENDKTDASRSRVLAFWVNGEKRAEYYRNKFKCDGILYVIDVADMRQILDCLHLDTSFFIRSWEWTVKNEEVYQEQLKVHLAEMAERRKRRAEERKKQREIEKEKERIKKQKQKEREKLKKQKQTETMKLKAKLKREKSKKRR